MINTHQRYITCHCTLCTEHRPKFYGEAVFECCVNVALCQIEFVLNKRLNRVQCVVPTRWHGFPRATHERCQATATCFGWRQFLTEESVGARQHSDYSCCRTQRQTSNGNVLSYRRHYGRHYSMLSLPESLFGKLCVCLCYVKLGFKGALFIVVVYC